MRTLIENGNVIAWNGSSHHVIEAGVLVFEGNEIVHVGAAYEGEADTVIDATGRLVIPGFVNSHLHLTDTPFTKGHQEDIGSPSGPSNYQNYNALYKMLPGVRKASAPEDQYAGVQNSLAELLLTGSTTIVELGYDYEIGGGGDIAITETIADMIGASGIRCYTGPRYRTRYYGADDRGGVFYENYPNGARERFEACVTFCQDWNGRYGGRLRTMLAPGQIDTCDARLLKETRRYADELKIPIQLHAGQSPFEFSRVRETEGQTSVEYMMETGLLGPDFHHRPRPVHVRRRRYRQHGRARDRRSARLADCGLPPALGQGASRRRDRFDPEIPGSGHPPVPGHRQLPARHVP